MSGEKDRARFNIIGLNDPSTRNLYMRRLEGKIDENYDESTEELYEHLKIVIREAANEALGANSNEKNTIGWFNGKIEELVKQKKLAYLKWLSSKGENELKASYQGER